MDKKEDMMMEDTPIEEVVETTPVEDTPIDEEKDVTIEETPQEDIKEDVDDEPTIVEEIVVRQKPLSVFFRKIKPFIIILWVLGSLGGLFICGKYEHMLPFYIILGQYVLILLIITIFAMFKKTKKDE